MSRNSTAGVAPIDFSVIAANVTGSILPLLDSLFTNDNQTMEEMVDKTMQLISLSRDLTANMTGVFWTSIVILMIVLILAGVGTYCGRKIRNRLIQETRSCMSPVEQSPVPRAEVYKV